MAELNMPPGVSKNLPPKCAYCKFNVKPGNGSPHVVVPKEQRATIWVETTKDQVRGVCVSNFCRTELEKDSEAGHIRLQLYKKPWDARQREVIKNAAEKVERPSDHQLRDWGFTPEEFTAAVQNHQLIHPSVEWEEWWA